MKRLLVITIVLAGMMNLNAQDPAILLNFSSLSKKLEKSDAAINHEKKKMKSATWFNRGKLMQDIYEIDLEYLREGSSLIEIKTFYKDPISIEEGKEPGAKIYKYERINYILTDGALSRWERTKMVTEDPLDKAYKAYVKSMELDPEGKMTEKLKKEFETLKANYKQNGINYYYSEKYKDALHQFTRVLDINKLDMFEGEIDTIMVQYAGIIAREVGDYETAIKYYKELTDIDYGGPNTWLNIKVDYMSMNDTLSALKTMEEAFEKYPDTLTIISNMVDMYIKAGKIEEGLNRIDAAIEANPVKGELYYWKGRLLLNTEGDDRIDSALATYEKAAELNQTLYYVYYDIGFIYFLQGQDIFNQAGLERDAEIRKQITDIATEKYEACIPMMENAYELNSKDMMIKKETLDVLKRVYYKLYGVDDERYKDVMDRISDM